MYVYDLYTEPDTIYSHSYLSYNSLSLYRYLYLSIYIYIYYVYIELDTVYLEL